MKGRDMKTPLEKTISTPTNQLEEQQNSQPLPLVQQNKSGTVYLLLALFLGLFGAHNFYVKRYARGVCILLLTIIGIFTLIPLLISTLWVFFEIVNPPINTPRVKLKVNPYLQAFSALIPLLFFVGYLIFYLLMAWFIVIFFLYSTQAEDILSYSKQAASQISKIDLEPETWYNCQEFYSFPASDSFEGVACGFVKDPMGIYLVYNNIRSELKSPLNDLATQNNIDIGFKGNNTIIKIKP